MSVFLLVGVALAIIGTFFAGVSFLIIADERKNGEVSEVSGFVRSVGLVLVLIGAVMLVGPALYAFVLNVYAEIL